MALRRLGPRRGKGEGAGAFRRGAVSRRDRLFSTRAAPGDLSCAECALSGRCERRTALAETTRAAARMNLRAYCGCLLGAMGGEGEGGGRKIVLDPSNQFCRWLVVVGCYQACGARRLARPLGAGRGKQDIRAGSALQAVERNEDREQRVPSR